MAVIISGKEVSAKVRAQVREECEQLKAKGIAPGLAVIIVGDDPASRVYVNNKKKACLFPRNMHFRLRQLRRSFFLLLRSLIISLQ